MPQHDYASDDDGDDDVIGELAAGAEGNDEDDDVLAGNPLAQPLRRTPQNATLEDCLAVSSVSRLILVGYGLPDFTSSSGSTRLVTKTWYPSFGVQRSGSCSLRH